MIDAVGAQTDYLLQRGETVGRFVVLGPVGRGGMGEVYAAYDPELDRKVALKLLRPRRSSGTANEARLLREAQAIAKLSHPNVVVVYDVGTFRETVFIAMEFVDGHTATYWLQEKDRPWREVLRIFQTAARGLVAAHDAGMIHRDFKPDNVMITRDGQVRVMDFGLARQVAADGEELLTESGAREAMNRVRGGLSPPSGDGEMMDTAVLGAAAGDQATTSGGYLKAKLTQTGAQVGTPAYMAPEQFVPGVRTDARTDQFSFCVALYEALYGQRPFAGESVVALMTSVLQGEVRPVPEKSRVPSWIRRVLLRGLATDPAKRYPSMADLLRALEQDPARRWRRWLTTSAVVGLMAASAMAVRTMASNEVLMCAGAGERLAGIWEPPGGGSPRKQAVHTAFVRTGKAYAEQAYRTAAGLLDGFSGRWASMYREACLAHQRGEQSAEVLDLRMACLQQRLGNLRALTDLFTSADDGVVLNAPTAAGALPALDPCADVPVLRAVVKPPTDPAQQRRAAELRDRLARLVAMRDAGHCAGALVEFQSVIDAGRALGYRPLLADALGAAGLLANSCGEPRQSVDRLREAYVVASAAHHDQAAAEAAVNIPVIASNRMGQVELAREWLGIARGALDRLGAGGDTIVESWLLGGEALVEDAEHHPDRALVAAQRSLAIKQRVLGSDHPDTLISAQNVGVILQNARRLQEAFEVDHDTFLRTERVLGRDNPMLALLANNEGEVLNTLGRHAEARVMFERAIDIWRRAGSDRALLAYGLAGLGTALLGEGRPGDAIAPLEEAEAIVDDKAAVPGPVRGERRFALARALWSRPDERPRATALARQARANLTADGDPGQLAALNAWLDKTRP